MERLLSDEIAARVYKARMGLAYLESELNSTQRTIKIIDAEATYPSLATTAAVIIDPRIQHLPMAEPHEYCEEPLQVALGAPSPQESGSCIEAMVVLPRKVIRALGWRGPGPFTMQHTQGLLLHDEVPAALRHGVIAVVLDTADTREAEAAAAVDAAASARGVGVIHLHVGQEAMPVAWDKGYDRAFPCAGGSAGNQGQQQHQEGGSMGQAGARASTSSGTSSTSGSMGSGEGGSMGSGESLSEIPGGPPVVPVSSGGIVHVHARTMQEAKAALIRVLQAAEVRRPDLVLLGPATTGLHWEREFDAAVVGAELEAGGNWAVGGITVFALSELAGMAPCVDRVFAFAGMLVKEGDVVCAVERLVSEAPAFLALAAGEVSREARRHAALAYRFPSLGMGRGRTRTRDAGDGPEEHDGGGHAREAPPPYVQTCEELVALVQEAIDCTARHCGEGDSKGRGHRGRGVGKARSMYGRLTQQEQGSLFRVLCFLRKRPDLIGSGITREGLTPLHMAAQAGSAPLCCLLLVLGADPGAFCAREQAAFAMCESRGLRELLVGWLTEVCGCGQRLGIVSKTGDRVSLESLVAGRACGRKGEKRSQADAGARSEVRGAREGSGRVHDEEPGPVLSEGASPVRGGSVLAPETQSGVAVEGMSPSRPSSPDPTYVCRDRGSRREKKVALNKDALWSRLSADTTGPKKVDSDDGDDACSDDETSETMEVDASEGSADTLNAAGTDVCASTDDWAVGLVPPEETGLATPGSPTSGSATNKPLDLSGLGDRLAAHLANSKQQPEAK